MEQGADESGGICSASSEATTAQEEALAKVQQSTSKARTMTDSNYDFLYKAVLVGDAATGMFVLSLHAMAYSDPTPL